MVSFTWSEAYSVNSPLLDGQHKKIFNLINTLQNNLGCENCDEELGKTLDALIDYARVHFAEEEKYLAQFNYPGLPDHQDQHDFFVRKVFELQSEYRDGRLDLAQPVLAFLQDWLTNHILGSDKCYAAYIAELLSRPPLERRRQLAPGAQ